MTETQHQGINQVVTSRLGLHGREKNAQYLSSRHLEGYVGHGIHVKPVIIHSDCWTCSPRLKRVNIVAVKTLPVHQSLWSSQPTIQNDRSFTNKCLQEKPR